MTHLISIREGLNYGPSWDFINRRGFDARKTGVGHEAAPLMSSGHGRASVTPRERPSLSVYRDPRCPSRNETI
jgi:hypothetical protein